MTAYAQAINFLSPRAYYKMDDDGATLLDSSGNGNHASFSFTNPQYVNSIIPSNPTGQAIFNNQFNALEVETPVTIPQNDIVDELSIVFVAQASTLYASNICIVEVDSISMFLTVRLDINAFRVTFGYPGGTFQVVVPVDTSIPHHYAFTLKSGNSARLYIDGVDVGGSNSFNSGFTGGNDDKIWVYSFRGSQSFQGVADDIAIYNNQLLPGDIDFLYNAYLSTENPSLENNIILKNPLFYYKMDIESGSIVHDESTNNNDGSINGTVIYNQQSLIPSDRVGTCLEFDGSSFISAPTSTLSSIINEYSLMINYQTINSNNESLFGVRGVNHDLRIGVSTNSITVILLHSQGTFVNTYATKGDYEVIHLVITVKSDDQILIYIDSELVGVGSIGVTTGFVVTEVVNIGSYTGGASSLNGSIDDTAMFNRVLSPGEVSSIYNSFLSGGSIYPLLSIAMNSLSPLAYYQFNEAGGAVFIDDSINGNDGVYTNIQAFENDTLIPSDGVGTSVLFDGSTSYADAPVIVPNSITTEFTIITTFKTQSSGGNVVQLNNPGLTFSIESNVSGSDIRVTINDTTPYSVVLPRDDSITTFMVVTAESGGDFNIYVNGESTHNATIGGFSGNGSAGLTFGSGYEGAIDDSAIVERAITAEEANTLYNSYLLGSKIKGVFDGIISSQFDVEQWFAYAYSIIDGSLTSSSQTTNNLFQLDLRSLLGIPHFIIVIPNQGDVWKPSKLYALNELVLPTDTTINPYYFRCISGGLSDVNEPEWNVSGLTNDYIAVFEVVGRIIQPISHSPFIP